MKLAEFEADGWQLDDGVRLHEEHPRTFWIPPSWRRYLLRPEQIVKLAAQHEASPQEGPLRLFVRHHHTGATASHA